MNDKTVFFWESSTPTLICILTHWAMVSSGLRDQHMHAGLYYTWQRVFSLVYLLWVFGAFWCKRIPSFKDNVPDDISCFHIHCECLARIFSILWRDWTLNSCSLFPALLPAVLPRHLTFPWQPHFVLLVKPHFVFFGKILFFQFSCLVPTRNISVRSTGWGISTKCKIILMRLSNQNESPR